MANKDRDDQLEFSGIVEMTNKGIFIVKVNDTHTITARISGKLKMHDIKVIVGDQVIVAVSPYDLSLGRIIKRLKNDEI